MLDFAQLPPEVNSALMYAGPGSGPMLAAAAAWEALAAELQTTASTYDALITGLADGPWQGSSAASMVAAATPQVAWLRSTAGQAEQAGSQAVAAASAYEAAFFATVPPPEIAANRALLMALLATNFLGQNTAAIAATEAIRRDVGPGCGRDVRLCWRVGGGDAVVAIQSGGADHQPGRAGQPGRICRTSCQRGRKCASTHRHS